MDTEHDDFALAGEELRPDVVLPNDNRARVADSEARPYRWVGQLESTWADKSASLGTATIIDDSHVLTCAHNIYDAKLKYARSVTFRPALNRRADGVRVEPYVLRGARWAVPDLYQRHPAAQPPTRGIDRQEMTNYLHDVGVVRLASTIPERLGRTQFGVGGWYDPTGQAGHIIGYSGDLDPTASTQYYRHGPLQVDAEEEFVSYTMSTYNGDSGAAVFWQRPNTDWYSIVAVHVTGVLEDGFNFGPALTDLALIEELIRASDGEQIAAD